MSSEDTSRFGLNRRRALQGIGATGIASIAGCLGIFGDDDDDDDTRIDPVEDRVVVDPDDIVEGGTLRMAHVLSPDDWDPTESASAPATVVHNLFYENLLATDAAGNLYSWLSESWEELDIQDTDDEDYVPYMHEVDVVEGVPDTDEQIVVTHPDDDPLQDDSVRVLTAADTQDAVDDGVYGMHFRHELHEGIEFHNGEELTAENVVASQEMQENSLNAGQHFDQFLHAEEVDEYTVDLYSIYPDPEAVDDILPIGGIFPTEITDRPVGERVDPLDDKEPIGTGAWVFDEHEDEQYLIVQRNDNYWLEDVGLENKEWWDGPEDFPAAPVIDEIDIEWVPEDSTRAASLEAGDVDLTYNLTADQKTSFDNDDDFRVARTLGGSYLFMAYPVTVEPFDDARVRQAINHLIPRTDIVEEIEQGWATEAWAPLPELAAASGTTDYEQLVEDLRPSNEFDPEAAEELLEEADVDLPVEVTLQTNSDNEDRVTKGETIVEALNAQEGLFDATLETPADLNSWFGQDLIREDYHTEGNIAMLGLSGTFNPDSFANAIHHPNSFRECCNFNIPPGTFPEFTEMIDNALFGVDVAEDPDLRRERYDEIWREFVDINANSIVDFGIQEAAMNNDVKGFNMYPFIDAVVSYSVHAPQDQQIAYLDRE